MGNLGSRGVEEGEGVRMLSALTDEMHLEAILSDGSDDSEETLGAHRSQ